MPSAASAKPAYDPAPTAPPGGQRPGGQTRHGDPPQSGLGAQRQQQANAAQAARRRAGDVGCVQARDVGGEAAETQADGGGGAEEGHDQQPVDQRQPRPLPRIPENFQRVEADGLGGEKGQQRRQAEQAGGGCEDAGEARQQRTLGQRHDRARRAVTQQRHADHHVGEVVPLDDREQPHQQDLVTQGGGREQGDGRIRWVARFHVRLHGQGSRQCAQAVAGLSARRRSAARTAPVESAGW